MKAQILYEAIINLLIAAALALVILGVGYAMRGNYSSGISLVQNALSASQSSLNALQGGSIG